MKKTIGSVVSFFVISTIFLPMHMSAQVGIPCNGPDCGFDDLIMLVNNVIKFLIFAVAVPLAALRFMYAGALLILNPKKEEAKTKATGIFWGVGVGFAVMLGAYVVIKTILFAFLTDEQASFMQFMFQ
ncbi:MAG: hypothetical protein UW27_C0017G0090 [Parcubacteria group bacterium GW2011_GWA1_44_13]|nr:MAG: hypothetical protein UW17_C0003G0009 [Candidatus Nomurabacteria bacterium GW2011_GWD1_44_10]KKT37473.1 MAG: hypothetical protein UW27_C0017G0090 [Parcubacteria group bacterium GW2011_GWA1_44_13]KKT59830.1 MAG: hypothetical protein UW54_C0019G0003 [Parcubacteria group bacterium GW2011_GWC1_44_26]HBB43779.1 hypothetical protein [Candidatus Yonathbacteria bacterium]